MVAPESGFLATVGTAEPVPGPASNPSVGPAVDPAPGPAGASEVRPEAFVQVRGGGPEGVPGEISGGRDDSPDFPPAGPAEPGATGAIKIRNVGKTFATPDGETVRALADVSLDVGPGEFLTLIGPSGCGKSTLLRLIAGLERADSGTLELDGKLIESPDAGRGLVFQNPLLFPWLNIHNNVAFGLRARKVYRREKNLVAQYLELVGLGKFGRVYPHHLSGGMAQRASLARALINRPRVLLLDEPLGALDAFTRMSMQDEILRIRREKRITMVMVTHDVDEAVYLADRIVVMTPGPGRIERILTVPLGRPRARNTDDFLHLRGRILEILNFAGHVERPAYQI